MFFKTIFFFLCSFCVLTLSMKIEIRQRRSPFFVPAFQDYLQSKASELIAQNETRNPLDIIDSVYQIKNQHELKLLKSKKSESLNTQQINNKQIEFDNFANSLLAKLNNNHKLFKRLRNSIKKLRSIAFGSGDHFIKDCLQTFNRYVKYSTQHAAVHIMKSRQNTNVEQLANKLIECGHSNDLSSNFEIEIRKQLNNCYDNTLAMFSSVILTAHSNVFKANESVAAAVTVLKSCALEYKNDELIDCIDDRIIDYNRNLTKAGTELLQKSIECLEAVTEQGDNYTECMSKVPYRIEQDLLDKYNFNITENCQNIQYIN